MGTGLLRQFLIVAFLARAVRLGYTGLNILERKQANAMRKISCLAILTALIFAGAVVVAGQSAPPASPVPPPSARQEPCWRKAGIDRTIMEQRRSIERDAHYRVDAVCENSSLTPQQRRQQAREIRERAKEKSDALITSDQRSALQACQQDRTEYQASRGHPGGRDPCRNHEANPGPVSPEPNSPAGKAGGSSPQAPENNRQN